MTPTFPRSAARLMLPDVSTRGRVKSGALTIWFASAFFAMSPALSCARSQTSSPSSPQTRATAPICAALLMPRSGASDDEHRRADVDVVEQPLGLGDVHADAAVRLAVADAARVGRPVDADARRGDPHPACAERVAGTRRNRALAGSPRRVR